MPFSSAPPLIATGVKAITAGPQDGFFIKNDSTLWGMGDNSSGQLGQGTTTASNIPVQLASNVAQVASGGHSGYFYTLITKTDGTVYGTGLGDPTLGYNLNPWQLEATGAVAVAVAGNTSYILKLDGSLWTAGNPPLGDTSSTRQFFAPVVEGLWSLPASPTALQASTNQTAGIFVSALPAAGALTYSVWRSNTADSSTASQLASGLSTPAFLDTTTIAGVSYYYWMAAINPAGSSALSAIATGQQSAPIASAITLQPSDQTAPILTGVQFSVVATGAPPPSYQWQREAAGTSTWTDLGNSSNYTGVLTAQCCRFGICRWP